MSQPPVETIFFSKKNILPAVGNARRSETTTAWSLHNCRQEWVQYNSSETIVHQMETTTRDPVRTGGDKISNNRPNSITGR